MDNGNKSIMEELKEICNKIVGRWYSGDGTQSLIFSFTDQLLKQADLTVVNRNKAPIQTHYTIGALPQIQPTIDTFFYFDIGHNSQIKYVITSLTKDRMDVHIYDYYDPTQTQFYYVRKIDEGFAGEVLKGIDSV